jgi:hypothetical protein
MNKQALMAEVERLRKQYVDQINEQMFEDADKTFEFFLKATNQLKELQETEDGKKVQPTQVHG